METLIPSLIIGAICLAIGLFIGLTISGLRGGGGAGRTGKNLDEGVSEEKSIHVWQELPGGKLNFQVEGHRVDSPAALESQQRKHLLDLFGFLQLSLGLTSTPDPASESTSQPVSVPQPEIKAPLGVVDAVSRIIGTAKPAPAERSIAIQIDEILQERLESPEFASSSLRQQGLRLMEIPQKGLVVMVGSNQYDGVDSVPDPQARELLHACVVEWENRTSGD